MTPGDLTAVIVEVFNPESPFGGVLVEGAFDSPTQAEVQNPESPFGGVQVEGVVDRPIQIEINTGSPVSSVFGRVGAITAQCSDYAACYQPLGEGAGSVGGWTKSTGTPLRSGWDAGAASQLEIAETLKALIDDLFTIGVLTP